jgi:flagellar P-ring protein precursor FlgI
VPAVGAQSGDALNVTINAINAKSLEGGTLMLTPLLGPRSDNRTVYAMAQGPLNVSLDGPATTATIQGGAKMEASVSAQYQKDGMITLILEKDFASFDTAQRIEDEINGLSSLTLGDSTGTGKSGRTSARAIDQLHVQVMIPELYRDNPIKFISFLLGTTIQIENHSSRVVINERDGVVVIGKDVEVAPVLVTHRNLRIEAGGGGGFVSVGDKNDVPSNAKLKSLADALNALDVPAEDLIAIIKTLKRKGDLYGEVVFQ